MCLQLPFDIDQAEIHEYVWNVAHDLAARSRRRRHCCHDPLQLFFFFIKTKKSKK